MKIKLEEGAIAPKEIWKDIGGFEGIYQVSSIGRIMALPKTVYFSDGRIRHYPRLIMKAARDSRGYLYARLCIGKHRYVSYGIHRLVALAFIENKESKPEVDHINTKITDNRVGNLRWVTGAENRRNELTRKHMSDAKRGKRNKKLFKKVNQLDMNGNCISTYDCITDASNATGVARNTISFVCKGKRNHAGGYKWQYV